MSDLTDAYYEAWCKLPPDERPEILKATDIPGQYVIDLPPIAGCTLNLKKLKQAIKTREKSRQASTGGVLWRVTPKTSVSQVTRFSPPDSAMPLKKLTDELFAYLKGRDQHLAAQHTTFSVSKENKRICVRGPQKEMGDFREFIRNVVHGYAGPKEKDLKEKIGYMLLPVPRKPTASPDILRVMVIEFLAEDPQIFEDHLTYIQENLQRKQAKEVAWSEADAEAIESRPEINQMDIDGEVPPPRSSVSARKKRPRAAPELKTTKKLKFLAAEISKQEATIESATETGNLVDAMRATHEKELLQLQRAQFLMWQELQGRQAQELYMMINQDQAPSDKTLEEVVAESAMTGFARKSQAAREQLKRKSRIELALLKKRQRMDLSALQKACGHENPISAAAQQAEDTAEGLVSESTACESTLSGAADRARSLSLSPRRGFFSPLQVRREFDVVNRAQEVEAANDGDELMIIDSAGSDGDDRPEQSMAYG